MLEYVLEANNLLTLNTHVLNQHGQPIPLADGWHPYFKLGENVSQLRFSMASNQMVEFDGSLVPTGEMFDYEHFQQPEPIGDTELDNCFQTE